jgi:hypothetical protein
MNDEELAAKLYEICKGNQKAWAEKHGYKRIYINQVCNGKKPMTKGLAALIKMEEAPRGYKKVVDWQPRKPK